MDPAQNSAFWFLTLATSIAAIFLARVSLRKIESTKLRLIDAENQDIQVSLRRLVRIYRASALFYGTEAIGLALGGLSILLLPFGGAAWLGGVYQILIYVVLFFVVWGWTLFALGLLASVVSSMAESSLAAKISLMSPESNTTS